MTLQSHQFVCIQINRISYSWWYNSMELLSAWLVICDVTVWLPQIGSVRWRVIIEGNPPVNESIYLKSKFWKYASTLSRVVHASFMMNDWLMCRSFLTPPLLDKIATISQTMFADVFLCMKDFVFWLKCQWSLFLRVQLTITQHWFK